MSTYSANDMNAFILHGPTIFTNDKAKPLIESGAVLVRDGIVEKAGSLAEMQALHPDINLENIGDGLLTPGLVNLHHHLYSTFARGWNPSGIPPANFVERLERVWWRLDSALDLDDIHYSAMVGLCESVLSGVTSVADHHASQNVVSGSLEMIASAFNKIGISGSVCFELSDRAGEDIFKAGLSETKYALDKWPYGNNQGWPSAMIGLHASMTLADQSLERIARLVDNKNVGFHFHLAEDKADQSRSLENYKMRAAQRFAKFDVLNEKGLAIHCVHLDDDELGLLRETKTNVVLCLRSNQNNAVGIAPWWNYDGINIGLGTDGIGSDILNEAKSALFISRHQSGKMNFGFGQIGKILLENNPAIFEKIAGRKTGRIASGYPADMVLWKYNPPTPMVADNIFGHYLFGLANQTADSVWANGKKILGGGKFLEFDYDEILTEARALAKSLWERI